MEELDFGTVYEDNPEAFDDLLRQVGRVEYLMRKFVVHGDRDQALQLELVQKVDALNQACNTLGAELLDGLDLGILG